MKNVLFSKIFNIYDDGVEARFYDLSDMDAYHENLEKQIQDGTISYDRSLTRADYYLACMLGNYDHFYDSINLFQADENLDVLSLVTFTRCSRKSVLQEQVYSMGYSVKKHYRGKGVGTKVVSQGVDEIRSFLNAYGYNYDLGPCDDVKYILESVVSCDNVASNKLASKLLNSSGEVWEGVEHRSKKRSKVYRFYL